MVLANNIRRRMSIKCLSRLSRGSNLSSRQREMTHSHRMARASWGNTCGRRVRMQISQVCIPVRWPHRTPISSLVRHICEQTQAPTRVATRLRFHVYLSRSDKLQRHYCQFVYMPPDCRQHEANTSSSQRGDFMRKTELDGRRWRVT